MRNPFKEIDELNERLKALETKVSLMNINVINLYNEKNEIERQKQRPSTARWITTGNPDDEREWEDHERGVQGVFG